MHSTGESRTCSDNKPTNVDEPGVSLVSKVVVIGSLPPGNGSSFYLSLKLGNLFIGVAEILSLTTGQRLIEKRLVVGREPFAIE